MRYFGQLPEKSFKSNQLILRIQKKIFGEIMSGIKCFFFFLDLIFLRTQNSP